MYGDAKKAAERERKALGLLRKAEAFLESAFEGDGTFVSIGDDVIVTLDGSFTPAELSAVAAVVQMLDERIARIRAVPEEDGD